MPAEKKQGDSAELINSLRAMMANDEEKNNRPQSTSGNGNDTDSEIQARLSDTLSRALRSHTPQTTSTKAQKNNLHENTGTKKSDDMKKIEEAKKSEEPKKSEAVKKAENTTKTERVKQSTLPNETTAAQNQSTPANADRSAQIKTQSAKKKAEPMSQIKESMQDTSSYFTPDSAEYINEEDDNTSNADKTIGITANSSVIIPSEPFEAPVSAKDGSISETAVGSSKIKKRGFIFNETEVENDAVIPGSIFRSRKKPYENTADKTAKKRISKKQERKLNDTDVELAIKLGYEYELARNIGFSEVEDRRRKKNESKIKREHAVRLLGCDGEEFTSLRQSEEIRNRFVRSGKKLKIKTVFTFISCFILLAFENINFIIAKGIEITLFKTYPILVPLISFLLMTIIALISIKPLIQGFYDAINFNASMNSGTSFIILAVIIYDIISIVLFSPDRTPLLMLNTAAAFNLTLNLLAACMNYKRDYNAFCIISSPGEKYVIEKHQPITKMGKKSTKNTSDNSPDSASDSLGGQAKYRAVKADLPGGFFDRSSKVPNWYKKLNYLISPIFAASLIIFIASYVVNRDLLEAFSMFVCAVVVCMPTCMLLYSSISFSKASQDMNKRNCAIIGEAGVDEYADAASIVFNERAMVEAGMNSIVREKNCNERYMNELVSYIGRIIYSLHNTVSDALAGTIDLYRGNDLKILISTIEKDGIEAYVNSSCHIFIGEREFMQRHKIPVKAATARVNSEDISKNNIQYLYVAVEELMCWRIAFEYRLKDEFIEILKSLEQENLGVAVETLNPLINDSFINKYHIPQSVKLIHLDRVDTDYYEPDKGADNAERPDCKEKIIDSGISALKENNIVYPLLWCKRIKNNFSMCFKIVCGTVIISSLILILIALTGVYPKINSAIITLFCMITEIPAVMSGFFLKPISDGIDVGKTNKQKGKNNG